MLSKLFTFFRYSIGDSGLTLNLAVFAALENMTRDEKIALRDASLHFVNVIELNIQARD